MLRPHLAVVLASTIVAGGAFAFPAFAQHRGRDRENVLARHCWKTNLATAKRIARKTGQPLMVVFRCVP
ncbi:MAG: hypothetical protein ACE5KM_16090 [Planctomycetaceae bacterium]